VHVVIGLLCSVASLVLMGVVAWMNYRFTSRLGATELDGQVFGIGSVAVDVMLALLSPLIAWGLREGRRLYAWGGAGMVIAFAVLSFVSAIGFAAEGRDGAATKRETGRLAVKATQERLERLQATRKQLGAQRPPAVIEAELIGFRGDRRWSASKQCTVTRQPALGDWCRGAQKLLAEQVAAREAERLEMEMETATAELLAARQTSGHGLLDAQIDMIAEGTGLAEGKVRVALLFLVAFVMQLGAGFGVALGLVPLQAHVDHRKRAKLRKPTLGGHLVWGAGAAGPEKSRGPRR
jgi:hypothetical protein